MAEIEIVTNDFEAQDPLCERANLRGGSAFSSEIAGRITCKLRTCAVDLDFFLSKNNK